MFPSVPYQVAVNGSGCLPPTRGPRRPSARCAPGTPPASWRPAPRSGTGRPGRRPWSRSPRPTRRGCASGRTSSSRRAVPLLGPGTRTVPAPRTAPMPLGGTFLDAFRVPLPHQQPGPGQRPEPALDLVDDAIHPVQRLAQPTDLGLRLGYAYESGQRLLYARDEPAETPDVDRLRQ